MEKQTFILVIERFKDTKPYTAKELEMTISDVFCGVTRASGIKVLGMCPKCGSPMVFRGGHKYEHDDYWECRKFPGHKEPAM